MRHRFRPPLWAILATLLGCGAMCALGVWQLHRGAQKQALLERYAAAATDANAPQPLAAGTSAPGALGPEHAVARGRYLADQQLLLDGQSQGGERSGYDVWTPLRLSDGAVVIVDRGWIPIGASRADLPPLPVPADEVEAEGLWRALPRAAFSLGNGLCATDTRATRFPLIVEYPDAAELRCVLGEGVLPGVLLLSPKAPSGFARDWQAAPTHEMPPSRHYAYAAQWFAFAATLFGFFVKLNFRKVAFAP